MQRRWLTLEESLCAVGGIEENGREPRWLRFWNSE